MKQHNIVSFTISHLHFVFFLNQINDVKRSQEKRKKNILLGLLLSSYLCLSLTFDDIVSYAFPTLSVSILNLAFFFHSFMKRNMRSVLLYFFDSIVSSLFFTSIQELCVCMYESKLYRVFESALCYATGHLFHSISYECVNIKRDKFHFLFDHITRYFFFSFVRKFIPSGQSKKIPYRC